MMADLKPYPGYKESGEKWLGAIPREWRIKPLKRWVYVNRSVLTESTDSDYSFKYLDIGSVGQGYIVEEPESMRFSQAPSRARRIVQQGDTLVSTVRTYLKAVLYIRDDVKNMIASTGFAVLSPHDGVHPEYLGYVTRSEAFVDKVVSNSSGVAYPAIAETRLGSFPVAIPADYDEQRSIVRFLRSAEGRINRLIRNKRRLIGLLREQKQGIINQAVTRGIDPNVPLKPSGIPWLGDIPEHWEAQRLKSLLKGIDQGISPQSESGLAENGSWGVLKSGCTNRGVFKETEHKKLPRDFTFSRRIVVKEGDVLVSRACGTPELVGSTARVGSLNYNLILSDKNFRLNFVNSICVDFVVLVMNAHYFRRQIMDAISGAEGLANNLPLSDLRTFRVAIPTPEECQRIVSRLFEVTEYLETAISRAEREIELLNEYRTRLIADVVTGKVDVRDVEIRDVSVLDEDEEPREDFMHSAENSPDEALLVPEGGE